MFNPRRVVVTLVILGMAALAYRHCAFACSCAMPPPPGEALAQAAAVFAGTVTAIDIPVSPDGSVGSADPVTVTLDVSRTWKGPTHAWLQVTTVRSDASCGYPFERGQAYLVYAGGDDTLLAVSTCGRTRMLTNAGEDLAALGEGQPPTQTTPIVPPAPPRPAPSVVADQDGTTLSDRPLLLVLGVILGLAAVAFVTALRLRP